MQRARRRRTNGGRLFGAVAIAIIVAVHTPDSLAQTAEMRLVALPSAGASDTVTTLPTSSPRFLNDASFVVEVWAQTTDARGLSSVSADIAFTNTVASVTNIAHSATYDALTAGTVNNGNGTIDNLSGSHLGPCSDAIAVSPNWARVAILSVTASASGTLLLQTSSTGSPIYGTAICGVGNIADAQIAYGSVAVDLVECLTNPDCDNGQFCDGAETCNLTTFTCQPGTAPSCNDQITCTDDSCNPSANGGAGGCSNVPNNANCTDSINCTLDACDQLGGPGSGCSFTPNHAACNDLIGCTDDACDQLEAPGTGCSNTPNAASCNDLIGCTDDACDQLAGPGTGCSNVANDANCTDSIDCTVDVCDQLSAPGSGCSYTPDHAFCDDPDFCNGVETCAPTDPNSNSFGCLAGVAPCAAACEHCVEDANACELCIFDLDESGVMGTGDFAFFAPCFGACYPSGNPCLDSNFDGDAGGCVGTSDFAAFVGCFGSTCNQCAGCTGPGGGGGQVSAAGSTDELDPTSVVVRLIAIGAPSTSDFSETLPQPGAVFGVGDRVYLEVWAAVQSGGQAPGVGLASAYVDLQFDQRRLTLVNIVPSDEFGLFASQAVNPNDRALRAVGGCAQLDRNGVGADGYWARVATIETRAVAPGRTNVTVDSSDGLHGFSRVGMFNNVDPSRIDFQGVTVNVHKKIRSLRTGR